MVVLMNFGQNPFKVEYRVGSKALVKTLPKNKFVAMKGLNVSEQITNRAALAGHGVTIYDFERNTYYSRNGATPTGSTMPYMFIGDNIKPGQEVVFTETGTTTTGFNRLKAFV